MKYINACNDGTIIYSTKEKAMKESNNSEIISIPETEEEFKNLCYDKYGKDIKFVKMITGSFYNPYNPTEEFEEGYIGIVAIDPENNRIVGKFIV